jgi:hypothetical protein
MVCGAGRTAPRGSARARRGHLACIARSEGREAPPVARLDVLDHLDVRGPSAPPREHLARPPRKHLLHPCAARRDRANPHRVSLDAATLDAESSTPSTRATDRARDAAELDTRPALDGPERIEHVDGISTATHDEAPR